MQAEEDAKKMKDEFVSVEHLLLAVSNENKKELTGRILFEAGATREKILDIVKSIRGGRKVNNPNSEETFEALDKYGTDLGILAREGKLDPVVGRDDEIRRIIQILSRRTKNNPILIGEPGVGKTAIVEGLSQRITRNDVPNDLKEKKIRLIDMGD